MKHRFILIALILFLAASLLSSLFACQSAAATPEINQAHHEFGIVESGPVNRPGSTAVSAEFDAPFESEPVCTMAYMPTSVTSVKAGNAAASSFSVVLFNITTNSVTFFVNNLNGWPDSASIHYICVGE